MEKEKKGRPSDGTSPALPPFDIEESILYQIPKLETHSVSSEWSVFKVKVED